MPHDPSREQESQQRIADAKAEIVAQTRAARESARQLLEQLADDEEAELDDVLRYYSRCYARPVTAFAQDIRRQSSIYTNLLEELKKSSLTDIQAGDKGEKAGEIRAIYEQLGLVPEGNLPNPSLRSVCDYVTDKITAFSNRLLELLARHGKRLTLELGFEQGATASLGVQMGWPLSFSIGVEYSGAAASSSAAP